MASMAYGWNQEKNAEIVHAQHLIGDSPKAVAEEFRIIQSQNERTKRNTLSFVLSPSVEDGKRLSKEEMGELVKRFVQAMGLKERQAIAFVHRDKEHTHIHLYVNRIGFDGKAYNDSFIGKRSQQRAHEVAREMGLTKARDVQYQRLDAIKQLRNEIKQAHENIMFRERPKNLDAYIGLMEKKGIKVIPSINKQKKLQGFRFAYKGQNLKGSEVHRSMTGGKIVSQIMGNTNRAWSQKNTTAIQLAGRAVELSTNMVKAMAKRLLKKTIKRGIDQGMGF